MNDNANDPGCHDCGNAPTYGANGEGQRLCATDAAHAQSQGQVITWDEDAPQDARQTPVRGQCVYCLRQGSAELFELVSNVGTLACKATAACQIRQSGEDPVHVLGKLLRSLRGELGTLSTRELAELEYDLRGEHGEFLGGFAGAVRIHLSSHGDSAAAITETEADRKRRARSAAAARGWENRKSARS